MKKPIAFTLLILSLSAVKANENNLLTATLATLKAYDNVAAKITTHKGFSEEEVSLFASSQTAIKNFNEQLLKGNEDPKLLLSLGNDFCESAYAWSNSGDPFNASIRVIATNEATNLSTLLATRIVAVADEHDIKVEHCAALSPDW